jgi:hypothetical protein
MRIYQGSGRNDALAPVAVRVQIVDSQDRIVRDQVMPLNVWAFAETRAADCRIALPVSQLPPGSYLLRVEAAMGERIAGRVMRFSIQ